MKVQVELPQIVGDSVTFRWSQDEPNPFQRENSFFYRYEGIDLTNFSIELFYEIFLSLQLRIFTAHVDPVEVVFPSPVPSFTVDYWRAYHNADNVTISPLSTEGAYRPWSRDPVRVDRPRKCGVLFGGGKDSTLTASIFSELYGNDQVVLFQFVNPLIKNPEHSQFLERRQESLMLAPARERLGVATQRGWTNYQANFFKESEHLRPHLELYTSGALPAMLSWGVEICAFTANWTMFSSEFRRDGRLVYRYAPSRPKALACQSLHYQRTFAAPIEITNIIMPFHALAAHWLLAERYPSTLDHIVPCTLAPVDKRWCYHCRKCILFAISCLACETYVSDFDMDYFLRESRYINRLMAKAESGVKTSMFGNVPWDSGFYIGSRGYIFSCHSIARIDLVNMLPGLSLDAQANLLTYCSLYGNQLFPEQEMIPKIALDLLGPELGPKVTAIAAEHFEIIEHYPQPTYSGHIPCAYELEKPEAPRVSLLPHLQ